MDILDLRALNLTRWTMAIQPESRKALSPISQCATGDRRKLNLLRA